MRQLRMSKDQAAAVTAWAARQPDKPNWSEAVRRLIDMGLARAEAGRTGRAQSSKLAAQTIEHLADPTAAPEDRVKRKRRLLKGPLDELRDDKPGTRTMR
jgi:hypothetical protein